MTKKEGRKEGEEERGKEGERKNGKGEGMSFKNLNITVFCNIIFGLLAATPFLLFFHLDSYYFKTLKNINKTGAGRPSQEVLCQIINPTTCVKILNMSLCACNSRVRESGTDDLWGSLTSQLNKTD